MKRYFIVGFLCIYLKHTSCWEKAEHPASFTFEQTFPQSSISRSFSNNVGSSDSFLDSFEKHELVSDNSCAFEKFAIDHEDIVQYDSISHKLEQFTTCTWARFTKHDGDHVLFTYSVHDEPREIQFWVSNVNSSSFISLAVRGHSLYRLNYPLSLKKWHHMCTSWNGKTGEWQLWVNTERVGRGFYNRLVSHEIESGGQAFSGGKSQNGEVALGLHFELTSLQVYKVALSAGKAHRNHKHHHVHKFDSNGEIEQTTPLPTPSAVANQPINPLLANGQFPTRVKINFAGVQQAEEAPAMINTNFVRGQFHGGARYLQEQLINGNFQQRVQSQPSNIFSSAPSSPRPPVFKDNIPFTSTYTGFGSNPANVQIIDEANLPNLRFKRKTNSKRELIKLGDGSIIDDSRALFDSDWYDGLAQFGNSDFKQTLTKRDNLEDEVKEHDKEPAEGEVEAVGEYCSYCLLEPFQSALVLSWKGAQAGPKTLKAKSSTICGNF